MPRNVYEDAVFAVDPGACNLPALVRSLYGHLDELRAEADAAGQGTDYVNEHPAVVLFVSQMAHLCKCDSIVIFGNALDTCRAKAEIGAPK